MANKFYFNSIDVFTHIHQNKKHLYMSHIQRYVNIKQAYFILQSLTCNPYRDNSLLCTKSDTDSSLYTTGRSKRSSDSDIMSISNKGLIYTDPIQDSIESNNNMTFDKLKSHMLNNSFVVISDAVGVRDDLMTEIKGVHDTSSLWKWLDLNISKFKDCGIKTIALEFVNFSNEPLKPHIINESIITPNKSSNVYDKIFNNLNTLKSIANQIDVIGLDNIDNIDNIDNSEDSEKIMLDRINFLIKRPNIAIVVGSGYLRSLCLDKKISKFYEVLNLDAELEPDQYIHFIELFCEDYE